MPKLKLGVHHQEFHVGASLFEGHPDISDANITAQLRIERTTMHLDIHYHLQGTIDLQCDRCLIPYPFPIDAENQVVYSFDKNMEQTDDTEVVFISRSVHLLDISQDLYDFVSLQVPLRHVPEDCPKDSCPPEVLRMLQTASDEDQHSDPDDIDPRWEALKALTGKPDKANGST